ncbi:MAG TPA: cytochrome ubiquinol oxidase subunit I [Nitrospira sp.]|nr:cytochrome ubiquinol oxidase subunit I [Nitrospira sp.]
MTDLLAARTQMAMSLGFHIVFAAIGIAMPVLMAAAEWRWLSKGDLDGLTLAQRWSRGTAILFAVGAVSGTVLSFELGLLWPKFMERAGPSIGPLFALEGFAFFTEAIFLGIYLYGWSRITPRLHFVSGLVVAVSGVASAFFVISVNAWMNVPAGLEPMKDPVDPFAPLWRPAAWHEFGHMLLAAFAATGFLVAGIHAWLLLRDPKNRLHRLALTIALVVGGIPALFQPLSGHLIARAVAVHQPAKLAAIEAHFETGGSADFLIGGIPDVAARSVSHAIRIPGGLSLLVHGNPRAEVTGLDRFPDEDWPPVVVLHIAFQLMVGCGLLMAAMAAWVGWRLFATGGIEDNRPLLMALIAMAPLGFVAIEAGWTVTEVGRQPWIIDHIMRTSEAVTPMPGLWIPMATFTLLYSILAGVVCWAMWRHIAAVRLVTLAEAEVYGHRR